MSDVEGPYELPEGWEWTKVEEIYDIVGGGTPSTKVPEYWKGEIPWITSADIHDLEDIKPRKNITKEAISNSATTIVPEGSLIVVTRVGLGKIALTKMPICFSQDLQALINKKSYLYPHYSLYCLSQFIQIFKYTNRGTTIGGVTKKQLKELPYPLPPLPEQRRIVAKIEELFTQLEAGVSALEKAQAQLKRYRSSVLKAAVEGKLTEEWRQGHPDVEPASELLERILEERRAKWEENELAKMAAKGRRSKNDRWKQKYKEPLAPDTDGVPELPVGWVWATPDQLAATEKYSLAIGPFGSNLKVSDYREKGVPLVFVRNIRSGIFDGAGTHYVTMEKAEELHAHKIIGGDVLITKMGEPPGDACLYPDSRPTAIITADCIKWTLSNILPEKRFFVHVINSHVMKHQILRITQGVAQKKVSLARFKGIVVPLPPLPEQHEIVSEIERRLSVADNSEATIAANLKRAARLRQSVLKKAFRGELVLQDPDDEPASALLEKIRAERAKMQPKKRRGRPRKKKTATQTELI